MQGQGEQMTTEAPRAKQRHAGKTKADLRARGKLLVQELMAGRPEVEALQAAGYSKSYATHHKDSILQNPTIRATFRSVLESAGVTDERIAKKISSLIDAKETKFFSHQGKVLETKEVDALGVQAQAVEFAAKLKGHMVVSSGPASIINYLDLRGYQQATPAQSSDDIGVSLGVSGNQAVIDCK